LVKDRGVSSSIATDFIYIGNNNDGNLATVKWLFVEVFPYLGKAPIKIQIIGNIKNLVRLREPELFDRHKSCFRGEISSIFPAYRSARAVLAPSYAGTGVSIKLIEALCAGKPTITTPVGIRGFPTRFKKQKELFVTDNAKEFARAMIRFKAQNYIHSLANAAVYDAYFSNKLHFEAIEALLS
jgi:glycosyltransferase involved in cell wall biosynthesis